MRGLHSSLYSQLQDTLKRCGPFEDNRSLQHAFVDQRIGFWRGRVPERDTLQGRVDAIIEWLHDKWDDKGQNALALFLTVLSETTPPDDRCREKLAELARRVQELPVESSTSSSLIAPQSPDYIRGDMVQGDKVAGDKITGEVIVTGTVTGDVVVNFAAPVNIPAPPSPRRPPKVALFVGRDKELAYHQRTLSELGIAVIVGMAGVGKTTLAATLAHHSGKMQKVFWHSFYDGEGVDVIIWKLAGFLAFHGRDGLWHMLQSTRLADGRPPPPEVLFDYLLEQIRGGDFLFCFDDFQFVIDDPSLSRLIEQLRPLLREGSVKVILTSRVALDFVQHVKVEALGGLDETAVRQLLAANDVYLTREQSTILHAYTGGNAELLVLAIDLLLGSVDSETLIRDLVEADDVENFLMDEIEERLTRNERLVMSSVALFGGHPTSRDAIEAVLEGRRVRRVVRDLSDRFLLNVTQGETERLYTQHAIVQDFFYESLNKRERRRMHRRAGEFFQEVETDFLSAARHYLKADDQVKSAEIASANVYSLIGQGHSRQLDKLLDTYDVSQLTEEQRITTKIASGQTKAFLGFNEPALDKFQSALSDLSNRSPQENDDELRAQAYLGIAELLELKDPTEALIWVKKGLDGEGLSETTKAALTIMCGTLQMHLGEYKPARQAMEAGLTLLGPSPTHERCQALITMIAISYYIGLMEQGIAYAEEALAVSRQLHDPYREARVLSNVAILKFVSGDWSRAIVDFERALEIATSLGSRLQIAEFHLNLGGAYINKGLYDQAEADLVEALNVADQIGNELTSMTAHFRLGELKARTGHWVEAEEHLGKAEQLAIKHDSEAHLPAIYSVWTEVSVAQGEQERASKYAQQALEIARQFGDPFEIGIALRAGGLAAQAEYNVQQAQHHFQQSFARLENLDPYEAARTRLEWAKLLLKTAADVEQAKELIQWARKVFARLGASQETMITDHLLGLIEEQK